MSTSLQSQVRTDTTAYITKDASPNITIGESKECMNQWIRSNQEYKKTEKNNKNQYVQLEKDVKAH